MNTAGKIEAPAQDKAPWERKDPHPEKSVKSDPKQEAKQKKLDKQLKDTFPASDAPSVTGGTDGVGKPVKRNKK